MTIAGAERESKADRGSDALGVRLGIRPVLSTRCRSEVGEVLYSDIDPLRAFDAPKDSDRNPCAEGAAALTELKGLREFIMAGNIRPWVGAVDSSS